MHCLLRFSSNAWTICSSAWFVVVVSTRALHWGQRMLRRDEVVARDM
jgi:hypothetical protein